MSALDWMGTAFGSQPVRGRRSSLLDAPLRSGAVARGESATPPRLNFDHDDRLVTVSGLARAMVSIAGGFAEAEMATTKLSDKLLELQVLGGDMLAAAANQENELVKVKQQLAEAMQINSTQDKQLDIQATAIAVLEAQTAIQAKKIKELEDTVVAMKNVIDDLTKGPKD